jgi:hypothetical protein
MNNKSNVSGNEMDHVSFDYVKKIIVVEASLENQTTANSFIFDTGAFYSKVEKSRAEQLQLPTIYSKENSTAQGVVRKVEMSSVNNIRISTTDFNEIAVGKLVYDTKSYSPCIAKDGILGANLIKLQNWKIDYEQQKLYFASQPFKDDRQTDENTIDFTTSFLSGIPKIEIEIEGKTISNVKFDLGYNGGLILPKKFAKTFSSDTQKIYLDKSTSGIFGSNLDTLMVKNLAMKIAGETETIPVEFSSLDKALLGNDFLEHFIVLLDYEHEKITLIKTSDVVLDKPKNLIPGILNDSLWVVNRTVPHSPFKIGDTIQTINGYQPKDLFQSHCEYFFNISKLLASDSLLIKTKNQVLKVSQ